ncbi:MAG: hypothetical protein QM479_12485 [Pseudomonadota bacterium]
MTNITNDKQLRAQLDSLDLQQQRLLAVLLVKSVIYLSSDGSIEKAINIAKDPNSTATDMLNAYKQVKTISTKSYTDCGSETDWKEQAEHFVASSAMACLTPENLITQGKSLVWKTAMQARMAKNCEMIEKDSGEVDNEALKQYKLTEQFLAI